MLRLLAAASSRASQALLTSLKLTLQAAILARTSQTAVRVSGRLSSAAAHVFGSVYPWVQICAQRKGNRQIYPYTDLFGIVRPEVIGL